MKKYIFLFIVLFALSCNLQATQIGTKQIKDQAITTAKIDDEAVNDTKLESVLKAKIPSADEKDAMSGAASPSSANVFATMDDVTTLNTGVQIITPGKNMGNSGTAANPILDMNVNDSATSDTEPWSAAKITSELADKLDIADSTLFIWKDGLQDFTANQSLGGFKITTSDEPSADSDLATKYYVDQNAGDMLKSTYDPNDDGKIAEAQLDLDIATIQLWKQNCFNAFRIGGYVRMIDGLANDFSTENEGIDTTNSDTYLYNVAGDYYYQDEGGAGTPATLVYWSKLESAADITSPQVGVGGTMDGSPTYAACKFNNGIYCNVAGEAYHVPNTASFLSGNECTLEFWIKTDFNVVNGVASDAIHTIASLNPAGNALMNFEFSASGIGIIRRNDAAGWVNCHDTTTDWTAGDLVHLAFVWDIAAGFDGTKTMAVYVNGVETANTSGALGAFTDDATDFYVCDGSALTLGLDAIMDNIKIWDYAKIDFSDKDTEGYATGGGNMELYTDYFQIGITPVTVKALLFANKTPNSVKLTRTGTGSSLTTASLADTDIESSGLYAYLYTADVSGESSDTCIRAEIISDDTECYIYGLSLLGLE